MVAHLIWRHSGRSPAAFLLSLMVALLLAACAEPQEPATVDEADVVATGRIAYLTFCLNCHGESGTGDGPLTELIEIEPGDITQLASAHNGVFPAEYVAEVIRGSEQEIAGHVSREMPVWYTVWSEQYEGPDKEKTIERQVQELVSYLGSIQK